MELLPLYPESPSNVGREAKMAKKIVKKSARKLQTKSVPKVKTLVRLFGHGK